MITIGDGAFSGCTGLTFATIGSKATLIGNNTFYGCSNLTSITIPDSVTTVGNQAFGNCKRLSEAIIGASVIEIDSNAFADCSNLTSISIPDSVITIGDGAFSGCTGLTSATIGSGATLIGNNAFSNCKRLTTITIGSGVTTIGINAFGGCYKIKSFIVSESNSTFSSEDGVLFNKAKTTLIRYPPAKTESTYNIPIGVKTINDNAFCDCILLTSIAIPDSVISIGDKSFDRCSELSSFSVSESNTDYCSLNGILYSKDQKKLIWCPYKWNGALLIPNETPISTLLLNMSFCEGITKFNIEEDSPYSVRDGALFYSNYLLSFPAASDLSSFIIKSDEMLLDTYYFYKTENLKEILVEESNPTLSSIDGCLYNKSGTTLIACPSGKTSFTFSYGISNVVNYSFSGNVIEEITLVSGSNIILKENTISDCTSLKRIVVENGANVVFDTDSIVFNDNEEHTIYVVAPDGYTLDTTDYRSNINILYGEPPNDDSNEYTLLYAIVGIVGLITLIGVAVLVVRHN